MKALVVFESMFGNTRDVAQAVADGVATRLDVGVAEVGTSPDLAGVDLLIVGAPTHAMGLSRDGTRKSAAEQAGDRLVSRRQGVRECGSRPSRPPC